MRRRPVAALLTLAAFAAAPAAPAHAVKTFTGETGQERAVVLRVADGGKVARVRVGWIAPCRRRGRIARDVTVVRPARQATTSEVFVVRGGYRVRQRGGYRLRVRVRMRGRRDVRGDGVERWTGTLRVRVAVRRGGRRVTRCTLPTTAWHALLPVVPVGDGEPAPSPPPQSGPSEAPRPAPGPWQFDMTGDSGDYITGGRNWVHKPPEDTISLSGGSSLVEFDVGTADGSWHGAFAARTGERLEAGRTYSDARRYPFNDDHHGLSISGMGRGCNTLTGEFTVHEIAFGDRGHIRRLRVSFVQHCEGGEAAARGTFDYSAA